MANVQIPNLPAAISLSGAEQVECVQSGVSVRATVRQIADTSTFSDRNIVSSAPDVDWLKATNTDIISASSISETNREGLYYFKSGDYSSVVDNYSVIQADDTPATQGAWVKKFFDAPCPEDFGWLGDGVANADGQAKFLAYANNFGGILKFKKGGQYKLSSAISITAPSQFVFEAGAYLDASGLTTGSVAFTLSGSQTGPVLLSANAAAGATAIVVVDATGISAGSLLRICSDAIYDPVRVAAKIGEMVYVASVSGTTINLLTPLQYSYTTAQSARIYVTSPLRNVVLDQMSILGDDAASKSLGLIYVRLAEKPQLYGPKCELGGNYGIRLDSCVGGAIYSPITRMANNSNTGYGISVYGPSQGVMIDGHVSIKNRHAITTNSSNEAGYEGIVDSVVYRNFSVYGTASSLAGVGGDAVDTHSACNKITIENGKIYSSSLQGINVEGRSATIRNVSISGTLSNALKVTNYTSYDGEYVIENIFADRVAGNVIEIRNRQVGATGLIKAVKIDGVFATNFTEKIINFPNTAGTDTVISYDNIECDASASTDTLGMIYFTNAKELAVGRNVVVYNIPYIAAHSRFIDCSTFSGSGWLGTANYASSPDTSASAFRWSFTGSTTMSAPKFSGRVSATVTNTAKVFGIDANTQGIRFADKYGNAVTGVSATAGSSYTADFVVTQALTIASGAITVLASTNYVSLAGEGATTDTLDTINGMVAGQTLHIRSATNAYTITVAEGGNLQLIGSASVALNNTRDLLTLFHNGNEIVELAFADNG